MQTITNESCIICTEFIKKNKKVSCSYCNFDCCLTCFRTFLMSSDSMFPICMNPSCKKELSLDFIASVTPNSFHNDEYRKKRTEMLLRREESVLPSRQYLVQIEIVKQKALKDRNEVLEKIEKIKKELYILRNTSYSLNRIISGNYEETITDEKTSFVKNCPVNDCRGFLSSQWKCGICQLYVCKECHVIKETRNDEEHVCNQELVDSIIMIKKESKECPSCGIHISKIDGCDQMWCVSCKTPWSWKTGKIETGSVHNPHYYQWLRTNNNGNIPRENGDIPCGGIPTITSISRKWTRLHKCLLPDVIPIVHRMYNHIRHYELPRYPMIRHNIDNNTDLSVSYMLKNITKEQWHNELKKREKRREKNCDFFYLFDMLSNAMYDLIIRFHASTNIEESIDICEQFEKLRIYSNTNLDYISKKYKSVSISIHYDWKIGKLEKCK